MGNNFFNDRNKVYSENLNDGILVGNAFDWTVSIGLPSDTDGVFPSSSDVVMAKVADVSATPNSNLSIGSTITNSATSAQVYRLTVYPNFKRFGGFRSINLTATGNVTFYIANKGGTSPIASGLNYDDLGNVPELKVLKEYDIVVNIPRNATVSGLSFVFQSSSADVSGVISQSCVDGLTGDITRIDSKNSTQDGRLTSIEAKNTQQDGRLDGLESDVDDYVDVVLTANKYIVKSAETFTITAKATHHDGTPYANKQLVLSEDSRGVTSSATTNANGIATFTSQIVYSETNGGVVNFTCGNASLSMLVPMFIEVKSHSSGHYTLYVDNVRRICRLGIHFDNNNVGGSALSAYEVTSFVPSKYLPQNNIISPLTRDGKIYLYFWSSGGTVGVSNSTSTNYLLTCDVQIEWSYV